MLEPIKSEAFGFAYEVKETARGILFRTLSALFNKGNDKSSPDNQKWHTISLQNLPQTLLLLAESGNEDFDKIRSVVNSAFNYFQFSAYMSIGTLYKVEKLYQTERANLGLANVLKSMGDLERRLGDTVSAQKHYEEAEKLYKTERANLGLANVLRSMGDLESRLGDINSAISKYLSAYSLYAQERYLVGKVYCTAELCLSYAKNKNTVCFSKYANETISAAESVNESVQIYALTCVSEAMNILGISTLNDLD